jgi:hypothetical protein
LEEVESTQEGSSQVSWAEIETWRKRGEDIAGSEDGLDWDGGRDREDEYRDVSDLDREDGPDREDAYGRECDRDLEQNRDDGDEVVDGFGEEDECEGWIQKKDQDARESEEERGVGD